MREPVSTTSRRAIAAVAVLVAAGIAIWWMSATEDVTPPAAPVAAPVPATPHEPTERPRRVVAAEAAPPDATSEPDVAVPPEPKARPFRVVVTSVEGGAPVPGARVALREKDFEGTLTNVVESTTAGDGTASLAIHESMSGRITVTKTGYALARRRLDSRTDELRVELGPGDALRGRVVFADTRAPAPGVAVRAWLVRPTSESPDNEVGSRQTTDEDGRFELAGVPRGKEVRVWAVKPGYRAADAVVTRDGPGPEIEIVIGDGGVLEGTVYDEDGKPMPGVDLFQMPEGTDIPDLEWLDEDVTFTSWAQQGFIFPATPTDEQGRYEFKGVRLPVGGVPQPRFVAARDAKGRTARSAPATFTRHGERMQRDIRFARAAGIAVRFTGVSVLPPSTSVHLQRAGPSNPSNLDRDLGPTDTTAAFEGLLPGLYYVKVCLGDRYSSGVEFMRQVNVGDGDRPEVTFDLSAGGRIRGVVVDDAGKPVGGIPIEFDGGRREDLDVRARTSAAEDGSFEFSGLPPVRGTVALDTKFLWADERDGGSGDGRVAFADMRVHGVIPGGPAVRLVLRRQARITGRLVRPTAPLGRLEFYVVSDDQWTNGSISVDAEGRITGSSSEVGPGIDVYVKAEGCAPFVLERQTLSPGGTFDLGDVKLEPGLTFRGTLTGPDGRPLANASLYANDPWIDRSIDVDDGGVFRIDRLPNRPVHVSVEPTATTAPWRLTIDPSAATGTFAIGAGVEVKGRVLDAAGAAAPRTKLRLLPVAATAYEQGGAVYAVADDTGRFTARVAPGRFRVEVQLDEYVAAQTPPEITVSDGDTREIELVLR